MWKRRWRIGSAVVALSFVFVGSGVVTGCSGSEEVNGEDDVGVSDDVDISDDVGPTEDTGLFDEEATDIVVHTEPPQEVVAGESFVASFELVGERGYPVPEEGVELTATVNQNEFATGSAEAVATTDERGVAQFELVIEIAATGLVLTASSDHGALEGVTRNSDLFDVVAADPVAEESSISGGEGVADGESEVEIIIELFDEFGNPVEGVVPEFEASGEGNSYEECSPTNAEGVAYCAMTSTETGEKTLEITYPVELVGETIVFYRWDCDESASPFGGGHGTEDEPYRLCAPHQLAGIGNGTSFLGDHFVVARNIDMEGVGDVHMIGDAEEPFVGVFSGEGKSISRLTMGGGQDDIIGLFRFVGDGGVIRDVVLEDVDVSGRYIVGDLVGANSGEIHNSQVSGQISAEEGHAGGLVGTNMDGSIVGSLSSATVSAKLSVGGLVGGHGGTIEDSHSDGEVEGTERAIGGLVGGTSGAAEILDSTSSATVYGGEGSDSVGGLVGVHTESSLIKRCESSGDVSGEATTVGGLVGASGLGDAVMGGTIEDSHSSSEVYAVQGGVGGLVGYMGEGAVVTRSYATGSATSGDAGAGGLVGTVFGGEISDSYATAAVEVEHSAVGGLVGAFMAGSIADTYATGLLTGPQENFGGLVGLISPAFDNPPIENSYWDKDTTATDVGEAADPLSTGEFDDTENFEGWDFEDTWVIDTAPDGELRPILQWQQ